MTNKEYALLYNRQLGWNVFPVGKNKRPFFKWQSGENDLQKIKVTPEMIGKWWTDYPDANIACVTGAISNVAVIDLDVYKGKAGEVVKELQKYVPRETKHAISVTPRGGLHYYFSCKDENIRNNSDIIPNTDLRANGGYIVLPPSTNGEGMPYQWKIKPSAVKFEPLPDPYIKYISSCASKRFKTPQDVSKMFNEGRRDEDLFHTANCLIKGGMEESGAFKVLERVVSTWKEPDNVDKNKWIVDKINSAVNRDDRKERHWKEEVENWIALQKGFWKVSECNNALQAASKQEKSNVRTVIQRLVKEDILTHHSKQAGIYRSVEKDCEEIDYLNASDETMDIKFPFELERKSLTYPKSLILVAGEPNAGKTAFMLNMVEMNMHKYEIDYLSSELGAQMLRARLRKFNRPLDSWKFRPRLRAENFADVINPTGFNIVDFLEVHGDNFPYVGQWLKDIFDKLTTGVALIAIQRKHGERMGRGGLATLEKPILVLNMGVDNKVEIIKCKAYANELINPNGWVLNYKLVQGCKFKITQNWRKEV